MHTEKVLNTAHRLQCIHAFRIVFLHHVSSRPVDLEVKHSLSCRSYIAIPIFVVLWVGYKLYYRTTTIPASEADLFTGKREIDEEEERFLERERLRGPRSRIQRIWDAL